MANFDSTQYSQTPVHNQHPGKIQNLPAHSEELFHTRVSYTLAGTEAANDTIDLAELPVGATLVPELCTVYCADPGTTLTLDVGYTANPDAYADGIVLSAGGLVNFSSGTAPSGLALEPMTTSTLLATVASANTLSAAVVLYFNLVWRLPKA